MTATEVKDQIDAMSDEERFLAAAYLQHLSNAHDKSRSAKLADRMQNMDEGKKVSFEVLRNLHSRLESQGL